MENHMQKIETFTQQNKKLKMYQRPECYTWKYKEENIKSLRQVVSFLNGNPKVQETKIKIGR